MPYISPGGVPKPKPAAAGGPSTGTPAIASAPTPLIRGTRSRPKNDAKAPGRLPLNVWFRIFQFYYDSVEDEWHQSRRLVNALVPLQLCRPLVLTGERALYAHPHLSYRTISSFTTCAQLNDHARQPKFLLVKSLTVRPSPNVFHEHGHLVRPEGGEGVERGAVDPLKVRSVHPGLPQLLKLFPRLDSLSLLDTLICLGADAIVLLEALGSTRPIKARIELGMIDLVRGTDGSTSVRVPFAEGPEHRPGGFITECDISYPDLVSTWQSHMDAETYMPLDSVLTAIQRQEVDRQTYPQLLYGFRPASPRPSVAAQDGDAGHNFWDLASTTFTPGEYDAFMDLVSGDDEAAEQAVKWFTRTRPLPGEGAPVPDHRKSSSGVAYVGPGGEGEDCDDQAAEPVPPSRQRNGSSTSDKSDKAGNGASSPVGRLPPRLQPFFTGPDILAVPRHRIIQLFGHTWAPRLRALSVEFLDPLACCLLFTPDAGTTDLDANAPGTGAGSTQNGKAASNADADADVTAYMNAMDATPFWNQLRVPHLRLRAAQGVNPFDMIRSSGVADTHLDPEEQALSRRLLELELNAGSELSNFWTSVTGANLNVKPIVVGEHDWRHVIPPKEDKNER